MQKAAIDLKKREQEIQEWEDHLAGQEHLAEPSFGRGRLGQLEQWRSKRTPRLGGVGLHGSTNLQNTVLLNYASLSFNFGT